MARTRRGNLTSKDTKAGRKSGKTTAVIEQRKPAGNEADDRESIVSETGHEYHKVTKYKQKSMEEFKQPPAKQTYRQPKDTEPTTSSGGPALNELDSLFQIDEEEEMVFTDHEEEFLSARGRQQEKTMKTRHRERSSSSDSEYAVMMHSTPEKEMLSPIKSPIKYTSTKARFISPRKSPPSHKSLPSNITVPSRSPTKGPVTSPIRSKYWGEEEERKLAEMWRDSKHLYVKNHDHYLDKGLRNQTYQYFATELDKSVDQVLLMMRSLRDMFGRARRESNKSGMGAGSLSIRNRYILKLMSFLNDHMGQRNTKSNLQKRLAIATAVREQCTVEAKESEISASSSVGDDERSKGSGKSISSMLASVGLTEKRKRKFDAISIDSDEELATDQEGRNSSASSVQGKKKRKGQEQLDKSEESSNRNEMMKAISTGMSSMAAAYGNYGQVGQTLPIPSTDSATSSELAVHKLWGDLLSHKIVRMPQNIQDRFKLHVDSLAIDALQGRWTGE